MGRIQCEHFASSSLYLAASALYAFTRSSSFFTSSCPIALVVSMGRRNTQVEPDLH